jgi:hypothetical protein
MILAKFFPAFMNEARKYGDTRPTDSLYFASKISSKFCSLRMGLILLKCMRKKSKINHRAWWERPLKIEKFSKTLMIIFSDRSL